jgi:hypothetical protein
VPGPAPNQALEPTPYSLRCASAFGRGSPRALGTETPAGGKELLKRFLLS